MQRKDRAQSLPDECGLFFPRCCANQYQVYFPVTFTYQLIIELCSDFLALCVVINQETKKIPTFLFLYFY